MEGHFAITAKKVITIAVALREMLNKKLKQTCEGLHTRVNVIANKSLIVGTTSYLAE